MVLQARPVGRRRGNGTIASSPRLAQRFARSVVRLVGRFALARDRNIAPDLGTNVKLRSDLD